MQPYLDFLRYRFRAILLPAAAVFALGALLALVLPPVYRSTTTVLVESQEIPEEFVRSTVTSFVEQRIQTITQQVMSRPRLLEIIDRFKLYPDMRRTHTTEEIIEQMRGDISLELISANVPQPRTGRVEPVTVAFQLAYQGSEPQTVQQVANQLASLYLEQNLKTREEHAATTTLFLAEERTALKAHIDELEGKIAAFKARHLESLPEFQQVNLQALAQAERAADNLRQQIRLLEERQVYLAGQLATVSPHTPLISSTGERILSPADQLEVLRTSYLSLRATRSDKHPDVIKMRREIEELERESGGRASVKEMRKRLEDARTELASLQAGLAAKHPEVVAQQKRVAALEAEVARLSRPEEEPAGRAREPENPAYINLATQLDSAGLELASLRRELKLMEARQQGYEARLSQAPLVERDYLDLRRELESAEARYAELTSKLMAAQVAQGLEEKQKGERFTIIDPAQYPERPWRPNRLAITLIGLILGLGSGLGVAAAVEHTDTTVRHAQQLAELTGRPVLATVPFVETQADRERARRRRQLVLLGVAAALLCVLLAVHLWVLPLDILRLRLLGRLGV